MAKGGFVVNWDGKQEGCSEFSMDFDKHWITIHGKEGGQSGKVKDWSTLSVHAVTKKEAEEIVYDKSLGEIKEEVIKDVSN